MNVLTQWETDLQKTREAEEKLEVMEASKFIDRVWISPSAENNQSVSHAVNQSDRKSNSQLYN